MSTGIISHCKSWVDKHEPLIKDLKHSVYLFRKSFVAMMGLAIILFVVIIAIIAPWISIQHPGYQSVNTEQGTVRVEERWDINFSESLQPPSFKHPFGTDDYGRDLYSMIIYGSRTSLRIGLVVVSVAMLIGISLGGIAGYMGGKIDEIIMRIADIFLAIPGLILAMVIVSALGRSLDNIMYAMTVVWWPGYARLMRGQTISIKENQYVEAARSVGSRSLRIIYRHILPNALSPLIVEVTLALGAVILVAAGLSFLGLGASPGTAEWGLMISTGRNHILHAWWYPTFPGIAILLTVLGFSLFGDGLNDVLDPRLRRR